MIWCANYSSLEAVDWSHYKFGGEGVIVLALSITELFLVLSRECTLCISHLLNCVHIPSPNLPTL